MGSSKNSYVDPTMTSSDSKSRPVTHSKRCLWPREKPRTLSPQ